MPTRLHAVDGPLVVIDRCVLAWRDVGRLMPRGFQTVLTDTFVREMVANPKKGESEEFFKWLRKHYGSIWVSRFWNEIAMEEHLSRRSIDPRRIISDEWTNRLRESAMSGDLQWPDDSTDGGDAYSVHRQRFLNICESCYKFMLEKHPNWFVESSSIEEQIRTVRADETIEILFSVDSWSGKENEWMRPIRFPDRLAMMRWQRLINWYAIVRTHRSSGFENCWHDAHYAFAASYVGKLATNDTGLIEAVRAVFPYVDILEGA